MEEEKKNGMVAQIKAHFDVARQTNKVCTEFIKDFLNEVGGRYKVNEVAGDTGDAMEITYDGGNHPEYASGIYFVDSIYLDNEGDPCFELDYLGEGYSIDRVGVADLVFVCGYILEHYYGIDPYKDFTKED